MSKISDTVEAKNVYGVFSAWDNDDLINNDFYVASVGSYVVRIKAGQVVLKATYYNLMEMVLLKFKLMIL
jgi:hypothetical protein